MKKEIICTVCPRGCHVKVTLNGTEEECKKRIAAGCGLKIEDVNRLLKQFDQMQQMMKHFSSPGAMKKMKRSGFKFPY